METITLRNLFRLGTVAGFALLASCGAPDTYQGNNTWLRSDGTTYRGAPPLTVSRVEPLGRPFIRESVRITEERSTNQRGETVIREKEVATVQMDFSVLTTLENGEQHEMTFNASGNRNETDYVSGSFTGSNGISYRASGNVRLSQYNPTFNITIRSKGAANWQGNVYLR